MRRALRPAVPEPSHGGRRLGFWHRAACVAPGCHSVSGSRMGHAGKRPWTSIDGSEQMILGDLSTLTEGAPVRKGTAISKTKELTQE